MTNIWDIDDWQDNVGAWGEKTFPDATEETIIAHLRDEVNNELHPGCSDEELADVALLLLNLAHKRGTRLVDAMRLKNNINQKRTWSTVKNEKGFYGHIKEPTE